MPTTKPLPSLKRLAQTLRRYYAPLGGVCIVAGVMTNDVEGFPNPFELSNLDGITGFTIFGTRADLAGISVNNAGDLNGDGVADIVIGGSGDRSWVVFGNSESVSPSVQELSALDGSNGFMLQGSPVDQAGTPVSGAGDINHDGVDDLIIGAPFADSNGTDSGQVYVVLGRTEGFPVTLFLSTLDGTNGFVFNGVQSGDRAGTSVSDAGDVNGDDIDDLIIGAPHADPNSPSAGESYVVFGRSTGWMATQELSALDVTNGFTLNGTNANDQSGRSVSGVGDVNGDGLDDLIIGVPYADPNGSFSGQSMVVFGRSTGLSAMQELSVLDGNNGFTLNGIDAFDFFGTSVSGAGDVNDDGFDDLIIGVPGADPNGDDSGQSAVVFGRSTGWVATQALSALDGM